MTNQLLILITGSLVCLCCSLMGSILVLKKVSLIGDAISHAVLPGIAIAFLLSGTRNQLVMLLGAAVFGLLTVVLTDWLHRSGKMKQDASMGTVFTTLFAIGVILITVYSSQVDLDQECVLYGEIAYVPWDVWMWNGVNMGPEAIWTLGLVLIFIGLFLASFYKEIYAYCFDVRFALSIGIPATVVHYAVMTLVSLTTVAAFESVGAILVVAMLIVPASTAYLFVRSLKGMLLWSVLFGFLSNVLGYGLAAWLNVSIAASMSVMAGCIFVVVLLITALAKRSAKRIVTEVAFGELGQA